MDGAELFVRTVALFVALLGGGYWLCVLLYRKLGKTFSGSPLQIKVLLWIPIFAVFLMFIYLPLAVKIVIVIGVLTMMAVECFKRYRTGSAKPLTIAYAGLVGAAWLHILLLDGLASDITGLLLTLGFASVLSDVAAFFFGNYFGKHHLPDRLNPSKSWEGVVGQIVGAWVGVLLARTVLDIDIGWWLAAPIGVGAAIGDLCNSYVKRRKGIKDWSSYLPGHGGYLDRFASLSGSIALTYYALLVT